eukprot:g9740.t1
MLTTDRSQSSKRPRVSGVEVGEGGNAGSSESQGGENRGGAGNAHPLSSPAAAAASPNMTPQQRKMTLQQQRASTGGKGKGRARDPSAQTRSTPGGAAAVRAPAIQQAGGGGSAAAAATTTTAAAAAATAAAAAAAAAAATPGTSGTGDSSRRQQARGGGSGGGSGGHGGAGGGVGGGAETPEAGEECNDKSSRLSPAMLELVEEIKSKIDTNIIHHAGGVAAPKGGSGQFPYDSPLITPPCPTIQRRAHLPKVAPFFRKPVYAWIPEYLWQELAIRGIRCPRCGCKGSPDGWNPKGPRRVFMEHDVAYIIGFRYKRADCEKANKVAKKESDRRPTSFNAWDAGCLERLPDYVSKEFPFILSHRSGIDIKLVDRLADGLAHGMSFSAAAKYIRESHVTKFMTDQLKYTSLTEIRRSGLVGLALVGGGVAPERFGDFDDATKYCGATPTSRFMRDMWRKDFAERPVLTVNGESWTREDYQHRVMQRWDGQILGGDASFKFAKVIRLGATTGGERARPVYGMFTVFNEYEQKPMKTNALSELMEDLKTLLYGRYIPNGFKLPVLWNTDDCCADRALLLRMSRELEEATGVSLYLGDELSAGVQLESLPMLELEGVPSIVSAAQPIVEACGYLRQAASDGKVEGRLVVGVDAEWERGPSGREKVATLQIAPLRGTCFVFHLRRGGSGYTKETFPIALKAFLEDGTIIKTGVAIKADATHILNDYGVVVANTVDLRTLAKTKLVAMSSRTLAGMTACLLGKQLPKDNIRFSRWGSTTLTDEQRDYAARDAVAAVLLYEKTFAHKDPITSALSESVDLAPGSKMRLYNASHSACVAVGDVVSEETAKNALAHWGSSPKLRGASGARLRVVVKLTEVKIANAFVQHAKSPPPPVSVDGQRKTRCTIGEAAPKIANRACGATTKVPTPHVTEQPAADRDEAGAQPMLEERAGEEGGEEVADGEPQESADFEGLVLWDVAHVRPAGAYTPPLHEAVMDSGDGDYVDTFSIEALPKSKVIQGGDPDAGDDAAGEDEEEELYLDLVLSDEEAGPQPWPGGNDVEGTASTPAAAASSSATGTGGGGSGGSWRSIIRIWSCAASSLASVAMAGASRVISFVRPHDLIRVCDDCNSGSFEGRCTIGGGPGISDAY